MKNEEQLFFKIEDYLTGQLSPEEVEVFEREIAADPELAKTVEMQRFEREGMEFMMETKLRAEMEAWKTAPPSPNNLIPPVDSIKSPVQRRFKWKFWTLFLVLGGATLFLFRENSFFEPAPKNSPGQVEPQQQPVDIPSGKTEVPPAPQELNNPIPIANKEKNIKKSIPNSTENRYAGLALATHEIPVNLNDGLRDISVEKNVLTPAIKSFKSTPPDYKNAILELQKIKQQDYPAESGLIQEMLAHAYFKDRQFDKAAAIFERMTKQNLAPTAHDQAEWYWTLSLLPNYTRQKIRVDGLLEKMINPNNYHEFANSAANLKKKLTDLGQ